MQEVLTLVWLGAKDSTRLPLDCKIIPDQFCDLRKQALLEKFESIVTTYYRDGEFRASCIGGTRNLIVDTLNRAHPAVFIATTGEALKDLAFAYIKDSMVELLSQASIKEQRSILAGWSDEDSQDYVSFLEKIKQEGFDFLNKHIGALVPQQWIEDSKENCNYLVAPIPHKALRDLIHEIINTNFEDSLRNGSELLKALKEKTSSIFMEEHESLEEDYQLLSRYYKNFQLINGLYEKIEKEYLANPQNTQLNSLKEAVQQAFNIQELDQLDNSYQLLNQQYELFLFEQYKQKLVVEIEKISFSEKELQKIEILRINQLIRDLKVQITAAKSKKELESVCSNLIQETKEEFKEYYGLWDKVPTWLQQLLGIISTIIFPIAIAVECTSSRGYWAAFFEKNRAISLLEEEIPYLETTLAGNCGVS